MEKKSKKMIRNLILFLLLIFLTFYIFFKDQSVSEILKIVFEVDKKFILIAIGCMCLYLIGEAINIGRTLKALGEKSTFIRNVKYALIGFFFSSITPAASGGQPMQVYYMYKDNINVAKSTLALLVNLTSMQIVTISIALISLIFNYQNLNTVLIICFIVGICLNASALALLLISILSKRMTRGIINFVVKILKFFKIRNVEAKQEWLEEQLQKYQDSAKYFKSHKALIFKTLITTYIQFFIYYSISYWVYRSFGLSEHNIFKIVSLQAVLFATVSGIPSPGAVGVSEGGFLEIFKGVYGAKSVNGAMLLSRGVNFYLFVMISAVLVIICTMKDKKEIKNENNENIEETESK